MAKASGNNVRWYRSKHNRDMYLRVNMRPVPALSYIKTPSIYLMDRYQMVDRTVTHERVFGTMKTVDQLYEQIPSKELPKSVRRACLGA